LTSTRRLTPSPKATAPPRDIGHRDAFELLLDLGADANATSTAGHTPLLIAAFTNQDLAMVQTLLAAGADPTVIASCNMGCAPCTGDALGWATELGPTDLIPILEIVRPNGS